MMTQRICVGFAEFCARAICSSVAINGSRERARPLWRKIR
jgi:hypothetical protein